MMCGRSASWLPKGNIQEQGRLKAEYTIEGMHIKEEGYRAIYDDIMKYVKE